MSCESSTGAIVLFFFGFAWGAAGDGDRRVVALKLREDGFGAVDNAQRQACEPGNLNAVAAVGGAGDDAPDEDDFVVPLFRRHREVAQARQVLFELGEFLVVRREERARAALGRPVKMLDDGPGIESPS